MSAATRRGATEGVDVPDVRVRDLQGRPTRPLRLGAGEAVVLIFTRTDCPIANRYAPEIGRLHRQFAPRGVAFWLVYLDPHEPVSAIRAHIREYGYDLDAVRDDAHALVALTRAQVTPEAAVFDRGRRLVYLGRIDDRYIDYNKSRAAATTHDLQDALEAVLTGAAPRARTTAAVGCYIADLR